MKNHCFLLKLHIKSTFTLLGFTIWCKPYDIVYTMALWYKHVWELSLGVFLFGTGLDCGPTAFQLVHLNELMIKYCHNVTLYDLYSTGTICIALCSLMPISGWCEADFLWFSECCSHTWIINHHIRLYILTSQWQSVINNLTILYIPILSDSSMQAFIELQCPI